MYKTCSHCHIHKQLVSFHRLKQGKYGRHSHCKECRKLNRQELNYKRPIGELIKCLQCKEIKSQSLFYKNKMSSLGVQPYCISCHKEKIYESQSKLTGYITKIYNRLRRVDNNSIITKDELMKLYYKQDGKCALTNELMTYYSGPVLTETKYESKYNIAIDKIQPSGDYTIDNIQLIGLMIQQMKSKTSMNNEQFIELCKLISNDI